MFSTNREYCDFVVWLPNKKDPFVQRITKDEEFWATNLPKAAAYFHQIVLPEMLGKAFTRDSNRGSKGKSQKKYTQVNWNLLNTV